MHNTWWVTRPKRYLASVPRALAAVSLAVGTPWKTQDKTTELQIEAALEASNVKRVGTRRDQQGGGARTYRSWLKSLGLLFMDNQDRLQLTLAGEDLLKGENPIPILRKQVLDFQYPSNWALKGASSVNPRFRLHPFRFILGLLADERLEGYLTEAEDVAKIVICYAETPDSHEDVVERILQLRQKGDASLETDYYETFKSGRISHGRLDKLFSNHADIANTLGNWLEYSQLIVRDAGAWRLNPVADSLIEATLGQRPKLIDRADDEEYFQRRYGIGLNRTKDLRDLTNSRTISKALIEEHNLNASYLGIASQKLITRIDASLVGELAKKAGTTQATAERFLHRNYPKGSANLFLSEYADMAVASRTRATEFEIATVEIFQQVFGYDAFHIGAQGVVPDIYLESASERYSAIIDNKAYKDGYSITNDHFNRMTYNYIPEIDSYRPTTNSYALAFFTYIAADYKKTVNAKLKEISDQTQVAGSLITATSVIHLVELHQDKPFTHQALRQLFSLGKAITMQDIHEIHSNAA
ncbi:MAG: restriction endonuclease FokI C-terminal domain-containing protein [Actinomycetaceae bacterium]|nr:restriction endonuclease FokI C-terminal domain-containing protein [Actinomycetaceae bacterium]